MISFNLVACSERRVFLEKSKTSSDSNLRIFSAFSHRACEDFASEQISVIKFCQEEVHSCFTIEIRVALSLVKRCWLCSIMLSSSESFSTRVIIKFLMPCFWSSGRIFHLVWNIIKKEKTYIHCFIEDLQGKEFGIRILWAGENAIHDQPCIRIRLEFI